MLWSHLRSLDTSGRISLGILCLVLGVSISGHRISPYDPRAYTGEPLQQPSRQHWLGTNDVGQDVLSQVITGTRTSVLIGVLVGLFSGLLSTTIALLAGVYRGLIDRVLMRIVDLFLSIPRLLFIIVVTAYTGSSISNVIIILILFSWAKGARIIRAQILSLKEQTHIEAAQIFGASHNYIIWQHLLPEILPLTVYTFIQTASFAIASEAGLAYLGLSDPSVGSWGKMFHDIQAYRGVYYTDAWIWWLMPPVFCLTTLLSAFLLFSHSLQKTLNPQVLATWDRQL